MLSPPAQQARTAVPNSANADSQLRSQSYGRKETEREVESLEELLEEVPRCYVQEVLVKLGKSLTQSVPGISDVDGIVS